jgi:hypothetical protein
VSVKTLERDHERAVNALRKLESERDIELHKLRDAALEKIDAEIEARFGPAVEAAAVAAYAARSALEDARVQEAQTGKDAPYPIGTIMVHHPDGLRGRIEVFKQGDDYTGSDWRKPQIGAFVIRHLKKDGTPSKRLEKAFKADPKFGRQEWLPEGEVPR